MQSVGENRPSSAGHAARLHLKRQSARWNSRPSMLRPCSFAGAKICQLCASPERRSSQQPGNQKRLAFTRAESDLDLGLDLGTRSAGSRHELLLGCRSRADGLRPLSSCLVVFWLSALAAGRRASERPPACIPSLPSPFVLLLFVSCPAGSRAAAAICLSLVADSHVRSLNARLRRAG